MTQTTFRPVASCALLAALLLGCSTGTSGGYVRETDGRFPQPERFDSTGSATLGIEDLDLVGTFEMRYVLLPGGVVSLTGLTAELEDDVLLRERLFRDPAEYPLRCNTGHLSKTAEGTVDGAGRLGFDRGAIAVDAFSAEERGAGGSCPGTGIRALNGSNEARADGHHDPAADKVGLEASLTVEVGGSTRSASLALDGHFTNRPPVARIASAAPGLYDFSDWGCPPVKAVRGEAGWEWPDPPEIRANRPAGLEVVFSSTSYDPDGTDGSILTFDKRPRVDLVSEQWAHWQDASYHHLGNSQELPAMTFARGPLHRVLLTVTDRSGARSQAECRFVVVD